MSFGLLTCLLAFEHTMEMHRLRHSNVTSAGSAKVSVSAQKPNEISMANLREAAHNVTASTSQGLRGSAAGHNLAASISQGLRGSAGGHNLTGLPQAGKPIDLTKDENSDKGGWKAQFEYDTLRKKLMGEEADDKSAEEKAANEPAVHNSVQNRTQMHLLPAAASKASSSPRWAPPRWNGTVQNSVPNHKEMHSNSPAEKASSSPRWAPPRWNRTAALQQRVVVNPRSQIILKKLQGGHKCDSHMCKLDQAFVLKLLEKGGRDRFSAHRRHRVKRHDKKGTSVNQSAAPATGPRAPAAVECYVILKVSTDMDKNLRCPERCPLMVKDKFDDTFCSFKC